MGIENTENRVACGGFAYLLGGLRLTSIALNSMNQIGAESDGSRYLSDPERIYKVKDKGSQKSKSIVLNDLRLKIRY